MTLKAALSKKLGAEFTKVFTVGYFEPDTSQPSEKHEDRLFQPWRDGEDPRFPDPMRPARTTSIAKLPTLPDGNQTPVIVVFGQSNVAREI